MMYELYITTRASAPDAAVLLLDDAEVALVEGFVAGCRQVAQGELTTAVGIVDLEEVCLVGPLSADGAARPVFVRLVAVALTALAALRLQVAGELREAAHDLRPHQRYHLAELPLSPRAQAQVGDVQELEEVQRDLEVGV